MAYIHIPARTQRIAALLASAIAIAVPGAVSAQVNNKPETEQVADAPDKLTDIVVTAERREEKSINVPIAIQSVSGDTLRKAGYTSVTDIQYLAPGVQFDPTQGAAFQIRGVGSTSFDFSNAKSVSVVVDDVVMDGQRANGLIGLVDIASVNVLMGPQGTLFGKNSTSGVISVSTNKPVIGENSLRASASMGEHEERILNATANLALGDAIALRVSGFDNGQVGFGRNVTLNKTIGSVHEYGGRARLLMEPSDTLTILLNADYAHHWDSSMRTPVGNLSDRLTALLASHGVYPGPRNADTADSQYGEIGSNEWGTSLRVDKALGDLTLSSITAYRHTGYYNATPVDLLPANEFSYVPFNVGDLATNKFSQEVHLASPTGGMVEYLAGAFYNVLSARQTQYQWGPEDGPLIGSDGKYIPTLVSYTSAIGEPGNTQLFNARNETLAAFGQLKFNISPRLSLTLGGRYTHDNNSQSLDFITTDPRPITGYNPSFDPAYTPPAFRFGRMKGDNVSFRIAPQYRISNAVIAYATYSTGYKPGGIAFVGNKYAPYRDETVKAWEAGVKSELFDRRVRLNLDVFRSDFTDFQATILTKIPSNTGAFLDATVIGNAGGLRTQGVEGSLAVKASRELTVSGMLSYTDATFTDYRYNTTVDYTGTRLTNAPRWAGNVAADYRHELADGAVLNGHADYAYRSEVWTVVGQPDYSRIPGYGLTNARASITLPDDRFEIGVYGRNLFNVYFSTGYQLYGDAGLLHYTSPAARRTLGGFVNVKF